MIKGVLGSRTFGGTAGSGGCEILSAGVFWHESSEATAERMVGILEEANLGGSLGMLISGTASCRGLTALLWGGGPRSETESYHELL